MGVYYKINEEILTDIANTIRQRGSTSAQMAPLHIIPLRFLLIAL